MVKAPRYEKFLEVNAQYERARELLEGEAWTPREWAKRIGATGRWNSVSEKKSGVQMLQNNDSSVFEFVKAIPELEKFEPEALLRIDLDAKYAPYIRREAALIKAFRADEELEIPTDIDYWQMESLSNECKAALTKVRPETLGQASRIRGVTPAACIYLLDHVREAKKAKAVNMNFVHM